jgi:class 3 adenylate cyclase
MREQPAGSVTLVFIDIEGSTRLLRELGDAAYRDALAKHRRVVREAFASGYEVDEEGDAFFYAFPTARSAVAAVEQAMRGLELGPIRIRVGMHTGEPVLDPPKYVGLDVHRAARVMAAGHGGQCC